MQSIVRERIMSRTRVLGFATVLASALAIGACGDSTAPKLAPMTIDSVLVEFAETQALGASGLIIAGNFGGFASVPTSACPYDAATQRFVCAPVTIDGFTTTRYYQLLDASGNPQSAFNRATTSAFRTVSDVDGSLTETVDDEELGPVSVSMTITGHDDQTLGGFLVGTHVLNGTSSSNLTFDIDGEALSLALVSDTKALVLPARGSGKYPVSGSIETQVTSQGVGTTITMTFNGTSTVLMTITSGGVTTSCNVDLEDPESFAACGV
jgi:hypothetical protein